MSQPYKYFAFISYSRKDSKVAAWLQKRLEWFRFPVKLVPVDRRPAHDRYVRPIYRDKTNLEVTNEHYWTNIRRALEESRFLIVLCSPNSAASQPVNLEVTHFLNSHGGDTSLIAPVVISGSVASTGVDAALCHTLRGLDNVLIDRNLPSMVADDATDEHDAWEQGFISLVSYMLSLDRAAIGDHIQREAKRQAKVLRRWLTAVVALVFTSLAGVLIAYQQKQKANSQTIRATEADKATQAQLIETKRQLERSQVEEGKAWLERGRAAENKGEHSRALLLAGRSLGFVSIGWRDSEASELRKDYPPLLSKAMEDPGADKDRVEEVSQGTKFLSSIHPTCLPLWASSMKNDVSTSVAFSPDGTRLASGAGNISSADDNTIKIWDAATGKELARLKGHTGPVTSVVFSPDGTKLASGSWDTMIKVWDTTSGSEIANLRGHDSMVVCIAFSPDGSRLASGYDYPAITLWDVATGKELSDLEGHSNSVSTVTFSPDGNRLASGSFSSVGHPDSTIKLWDVLKGKELATLTGHSSGVKSIAFSPDGSRLASGSDDNTIRIWDGAAGKELAILKGHSSGVNGVTFSPDGSGIASGSDDNTIKLWDAATGKEIASLLGHSASVWSLAFSPDGSRLASGSHDNTIKLWDVAPGNALASFRGRCIAVSPDGTLLASGSWEDRTIKLWDTATAKELACLQGHTGGVTSVTFSPDGNQLASGSADKSVKLWDTTTGKELATLIGHSEMVDCVAYNSIDGRLLASGAWDKTIKLWDGIRFKEMATLKGHTEMVQTVVFSSDGSRLASGSNLGRIKIWETTTGREIGAFDELEVTGKVANMLAFSPDKNRFASAYWDKSIALWDIRTGKEIPISTSRDQVATRQMILVANQRLNSNSQRIADIYDKAIYLVHTDSKLDLTAPLRAGLAAFRGREVIFPSPTQTKPMLHLRQDMLAQLADPKLTPERRAELRMELCTKASQFRAATALWQRLLQGEWPGFEGATVPTNQAPATIPADSPIRRLYLLALIDAAKHPQIHGHPTICQTTAQIVPVLTKEMMEMPTISLAMMSLMQMLAKDESAAMKEPRATLMKKLEEVATKEWLTGLRDATGR